MNNFLMFLSIFISFASCTKNPAGDSVPVVVNESSNWLGTAAQEYAGPQIVRMAYVGIPFTFASDERYLELKESGITHETFWFPSNTNEGEKALDAANKVGIKLILWSSDITTDPESVVARFKDHPALAAYYLVDEPSSDLFLFYGAIAERIRAVDKVHSCYINLLPITSSDPYFGKNYKEYVNEFITKINPEFLSYDFYTIYKLKDNNELITDPQMFENLEVIRDAALKANKEFWAFCLSASHSVAFGAKLYPEPVLGTMRLYVYSDLAYGAQGIEYFTYWSAGSKDDNTSAVRFITAPISFEGIKGPIYDRLKTINTEIKNLSFVFAGAKVKWVRHTGSTVPKGTTKLTTELGSTPFTKLQATGGLVVSLLEKGEKSYLVVVNRDPAKTIDLTLEVKSSVKRVLKSGALIDAEGKLKITEGDVAIYAWTTI